MASSLLDSFFGLAHELTCRGEPFATAIVVRSERPTSGKPGDKAIITSDGVMHGWIGGSCAQPTVIREARRALAEDASRFIRLSANPTEQVAREGLHDLPMSCYSGGTLEIYIEPHRPRPRLLIVGNLPVAQALAHLGRDMNFHVIACDPAQSGAMQHADEVLTTLDELGQHINPQTYVVVASHGNYDEPALIEALQANAPYVGLVASPKRAASVRLSLQDSGLMDDDLRVLKSPAGLDIQARRGDEIALSIMAEIVLLRHAGEGAASILTRAEGPGRVAADPATAPPDPSTPRTPLGHFRGGAATAIDPVCGMEVDIQTALHTSTLAGQTYYFCCPQCKRNFDKNPQKWLDKRTSSPVSS